MPFEPSRIATILPVAKVTALAVAFGLLASAPAYADDLHACAAASERAQSRRMEGKLAAALGELAVCTRPSCPAVVRADCEQWLSEVTASLSSIVVSARDSAGHDLVDVRLRVDGVLAQDPLTGKAMIVDPGVHELRYEHAGSADVVERVLVREAEKNRLLTAVFAATPVVVSTPAAVLPSPRTAAPAPRASSAFPLAPIVAGGAGTLGLVSFAYFGLSASSHYRELRDGCGAAHACSESALDAVRGRSLAADVSLGIGIVGLAAAGILYVALRPAQMTVTVAPTASGGALGVAGAF